jgi:hypothetical protein
MSTPGLSLVGFMTDQAQAIHHLRTSCIPDPIDRGDAGLISDWNYAKSRLLKPFPNAGQPKLQPIPMSDPHIVQLMQVPWAGLFLPLLAQGATFQMIEIDPLLAFQFAVDEDRSDSHCGALTKPPTRDELLNVCLPLVQSNDAVHISGVGQPRAGTSIIIKSRSLNLLVALEGPLNPNAQDVWGVQLSWTLPFVHVVRLNGRCYLHNGFHRSLGVRAAGATEMPCMFRDVPDAASANILPPGTFDLGLLESANPPTVGHFTQGYAKKVSLRATTRIIQINWAQHTMFDE